MRWSWFERVVLLAGVAVASAGCSGPAQSPESLEVKEGALGAPGGFVLLATGGISTNDRSGLSPQILGGDIGAAGVGISTSLPTVVIGSDSLVDHARVIIGARVNLHDRASVGVVDATQITAPHATYTSQAAYVTPPAVPAIKPVTPGTAPVTVNSGQTLSLAAGNSGAVTVHGTLQLTGGTYQMASLTFDNDARLVANAASVVRVAQGLRGSDRVHFSVATGLQASALRIVVAGTNSGTTSSIILGNDPNVVGLFLANAGIVMGDRLVAVGAMAAHDITLGHDIRVTFQNGFPCDADAMCADASACTGDACTDGFCVNTPVANGTACSDSNACTQTDQCQSGACVGSNPKTCTASDQCHKAGTCNPTDGSCSNPAAPNGTSCTDGNSCTTSDNCQAGLCSGTAPTCTTPQGCDVVGSCGLTPVFDCIVKNADGSFDAFFGYKNGASTNLSLAVGATNQFSPAPADRRQPTLFTAGGRDFWVVTHSTGADTSWTLGGVTVTATASSTVCPPFPPGGEGDEEDNGDVNQKFHPPVPGAAPDPSVVPDVTSNNLFPLVTLPVVAYPQAPISQSQSGAPIAFSLIDDGDRATRSAEVVIINRTSQILTFVEGQFEGQSEAEPPSGIAPGSYGDLQSGSDGFLQGTGGHITYSFGGNTLFVDWDNPFIGSNSYDSALNGPSSGGFVVDRVGGEGNRSTVFFILRSTSTAATNCPAGTHQWLVDSLRSPEKALTGFEEDVGFVSTPAKILLGVGKWASTGCIASRVVGKVVQRAHSTDDFYTIDVMLEEFDGAFLTDSGKAVRIEVPPLIGEVTLPGLLEIAAPNMLAVNPANTDIKLHGMPAVGSRIIFSGDVFIDHGSFLEVHPSTPIQAAPDCSTFGAGTTPPLYCNKILTDFFTWDTGQTPTPMGRGGHRACFLTGMRGRFQDPADEIHAVLDPATNNWFLTGKTGSGGDPLHAQARCVAASEISGESSWNQGDNPVNLGDQGGDRACFLTRVSGHFEGAGESVNITNDTMGGVLLRGTSGQAGVGASARCIGERSRTDFGFGWFQGNATQPMEFVSLFPACFLMGVGGHFEGGGEEVVITADSPTGALQWELGGKSQQNDLSATAQCVGP